MPNHKNLTLSNSFIFFFQEIGACYVQLGIGFLIATHVFELASIAMQCN